MSDQLSAVEIRNLAYAMQQVERLLLHTYISHGENKQLRKAFPPAKKLRDGRYSVELFKLCAELEDIRQ